MKKALAILLTLVMIVGLMAGCGSTSTGEEPAAESKDIKIALITMDSIDQHWITLNEGAQKAAAELGVTVTFMAPNTKDDAQQIEAELDAYMALVESLLSDGGFQVQEGASDREGYETKMVVSYRDLKGSALQYELHYNSIARQDKDDRDDDDDDFDDRFENETEEEYGIEGIMVIDGADYAIRGERETESEGSETESETSFRVTLSDASYMLVEQSYESERNETEQEYSYSVYENGSLTERSSFEYEEENGETELKMTSRKGGESSVFYFERETVRGEEVIRIRVGSGGAAQSYYVRVQTDADGNKDYVYEQIGR